MPAVAVCNSCRHRTWGPQLWGWNEPSPVRAQCTVHPCERMPNLQAALACRGGAGLRRERGRGSPPPNSSGRWPLTQCGCERGHSQMLPATIFRMASKPSCSTMSAMQSISNWASCRTVACSSSSSESCADARTVSLGASLLQLHQGCSQPGSHRLLQQRPLGAMPAGPWRKTPADCRLCSLEC